MKQKLLSRFFAASLIVESALFATQAQAQLINFDLTGGMGTADVYTTGPAVFGTASSKWNENNNAVSSGNISNLSLFDDTGAATSVTVSYAPTGSGYFGGPTGTFAALGISVIEGGTVTLAGLVPGGAYKLAVFSGANYQTSFTVDGQTKSIGSTGWPPPFPPYPDWSSLNEGVQYVLFQALANGSGELEFKPNPIEWPGFVFGSPWSAFQLQDIPASVPEPGYVLLMAAGLSVWAASRRKPSSAA